MLLKDKVVIVSGIGPGMGIKLAVLAAQEGAAGVVLVARTPAKLDDAEAAIRALDLQTPLLKMPTDIAVRAQCDAVARETIARFGRIDALINSAYVHGEFATAEHAKLEDWHGPLDVNLFGSMNMTQAVVPQMKAQGGGSIVMINTMATRRPNAVEIGYAVSKGALSTAAAYLAEDLGKYGIRVNSAYMGWMWGASVQGYFEAQSKERGVTVESLKAEVAKDIALRRIPEDGECAKAAIFLASDYASAITGAQLDVNGGHFLPS
ncbi:short-chain dehydrogenase [Pandoraea terrae]|uniref:Short-chain dehydrogenase n=1 Tax=Pandoraea terrae TaxID=1537710 RepID=A0A5E4Z2H3_9BURK|nr:SDR family oxidoreductase [Pandoraea terrae]VVE55354.1 short-chain dehydrogenase [Pandoraea terrae]